MIFRLRQISDRVYAGLIIWLFIAPILLSWLGESFYLDLLTRSLILAIAVLSLSLLIEQGGMVSLGHAAYIGIGAYSVGIPSYYDIHNGFIHLGLAVLCSGVFALLTGAICLRTRGLYFILITLAFTQMLFFTLISIETYGANDGLVINFRSEFNHYPDLENPVTLYYTVLIFLLIAVYLVYRLSESHFGRVLIATKHNGARMQSLGYPGYHYKLCCYVISGILCGVAGFFLANFNHFISPSMVDWIHSGELIFMLLIGGTGTVLAPLIGTLSFLLVEELLSGITLYWRLYFGLLLILLVMFGKGGLHGLLIRLNSRRTRQRENQD